MNPETKVTLAQIKQLCVKHGITYLSHERITSGFSHEVHRLNDDLVIKLFAPEHAEKFQSETAALGYDGTFLKPRLVASGMPNDLVDRYYIIMSYVPGRSLGGAWHQASNAQRKALIATISQNLQSINSIQPETLKLEGRLPWQTSILQRADTLTSNLVDKHIIDAATAKQALRFAHDSSEALAHSELHTVYWDIHFDNFIVNESFELQAFIDLENIELTALDYPLFVIRKQMHDPAKYLSLENEKHAKEEDYKQLESWYRQYYPEMFAFAELERRIQVYQLLDTLHLLTDWSHVKELHTTLRSLITL